MFGPAAAVLGLSVPYRQPPPLPQGVNGSSGSGSGNLNNGADGNGGTASWSMAFHSMLESILRDGEDMAVMVAYGTIRRHFRRLRHLLDEVTVPRVVVVDAAEGGNVLVDFDPESGEEGLVRISGLRDWSYCVFGDPLLASVFSDEPPPSEEFLAGFNNGNGGKWSSGEEETETETETETSAAGMALNRDLIEDTETAGTRLLLYQMYHATVSIVKEFYRPRTQSSRRELEARKRLTEALARLEQVHEDPKRRHQRPNGEMSPAKRARQDDGGGGG
ncbi:hypothetical protein B0T17DRAFT_544728 [Bombardia bombarda]|uniref:Uncharacterized protein n=1 Tax=Bombardia bombarda TaxID=252184 RepID=A0AA39W430_9PEZI|nr:hypothetical protein B0T17DRAFT_544728 [Bombardia bombarda]